MGCKIFFFQNTNGLRTQGFIPGRVIPKIKNIVLDASTFNTQYYKVLIKGKLSNPEKELHSSLHFGNIAIEKVAFGLPLTTVSQLMGS